MQTNLEALEETLAGLQVPSAVAAMLRSLAAALDENPSKASLWREYREALRLVLEGQPDDEAEHLLEAIRRAQGGDAAH